MRFRVDIRHPLLYIYCLWHNRARTVQLVQEKRHFCRLVHYTKKKKLARAQYFSRPKIDIPPFTHTPSSHNTAYKLAGGFQA